MLALQALVTLAAALSVAAAPGITLRVEGADTVTDVDNLKVSTKITNSGDETLRILHHPLGPLSKIPTNGFSLVNSKGSSAGFGGAVAKYVPTVAAANGAFTTLAPGESVTVDRDLSDAYNLTATGAGTYDVKPNELFYLVDDKKEVFTLKAQVSKAHKVNIKGRLAKARPEFDPTSSNHTLTKRGTFTNCIPLQQYVAGVAGGQAHNYAVAGIAHLDAMAIPSKRFITWFGGFDWGRGATIRNILTPIKDVNFDSFRYDCSCTDQGVYAYVYPNDFGKIYFCGVFWKAPATGTDTIGGTLVHEASHFYAIGGGTSDYAYGQSACKNLAINNAGNAVRNADNYEYFIENNPYQG
ncbi:peptidyl-Lys metalloendopeptidase [Ephemerocybe angulata]|uniref:Peptidyl-Lys metalloendopeptidase n=1 Tax=Ephemerocybe angulata TaxID=980116 RepID=A0A8H6HDA5_9AGAR|nr:peptidyl-Lys metalloendopeptidase [Tulosesus angulatus]